MKLPKSFKLPEGTVIGKSAAESGILGGIGSIADKAALEEMRRGLGVPTPKGRIRHELGRMNKTESAYALHLNNRVYCGEVHCWYFESFKIRLADKTWLTVDFLVILADGTVELHEVKGWMEDDAAVKIKVVAEQYPMFPFWLVKKEKSLGWSMHRVSNGV